MPEQILLRCPRCARELTVARESYDPSAATVAVTLCPECIDATLAFEPGIDYEDGDGRPIEWAEASAPRTGAGL